LPVAAAGSAAHYASGDGADSLLPGSAASRCYQAATAVSERNPCATGLPAAAHMLGKGEQFGAVGKRVFHGVVVELIKALFPEMDTVPLIGLNEMLKSMNFFYQKAVNAKETGEASEDDYRYPGPRPQTKEAAIVMLGDVVEAATRTLKDPTHSRLKGIIEELVDGRFQEGQLNESPLTLRDLERIKESFLTILAGTFHTRVEYPDRETPKSIPNSEKDKEAGTAS